MRRANHPNAYVWLRCRIFRRRKISYACLACERLAPVAKPGTSCALRFLLDARRRLRGPLLTRCHTTSFRAQTQSRRRSRIRSCRTSRNHGRCVATSRGNRVRHAASGSSRARSRSSPAPVAAVRSTKAAAHAVWLHAAPAKAVPLSLPTFATISPVALIREVPQAVPHPGITFVCHRKIFLSAHAYA